MSSEFDVTIQWRMLFKEGNLSEELLDEAEQLLDELSDVSPLRQRFAKELAELCARLPTKEKRRPQ